MTEADRKRAYRSLLQGLIEEEKRRWLALLQGPVPLTRKQMQELANRLEQTWFPSEADDLYPSGIIGRLDCTT
jgi:DNA-directed RNA polymerase specialized sigma subunit